MPIALAVLAVAMVVASLVLIAAIAPGQGSSLDTYAVAGLVLGGSYSTVGALIATRRPDNAIGWVFLVVGLSQAGNTFASFYAIYGLIVHPGSLPLAAESSWLAVWAWAPGYAMLVTLTVLLFPDGRLPSRRWRPVAWGSFVMLGLLVIPTAIASWPVRGLTLLLQSAGSAAGPPLQFIGVLASPFLAAASVVGLGVRFRRSVGVERQQLKWFTYAAIPSIGLTVLVGLVETGPVLGRMIAILATPLLPIAAAVAVLRYRLYDIDRIVSRTVTYAAITAVLAISYIGAVIVLQGLLAKFTSGNTVTVAISTLLVAALFQPVRRRVQAVVDRRFNRARYDAAVIVSEFSRQARDEVDLEALLTAVDQSARRAVAPVTINVWLRSRNPR